MVFERYLMMLWWEMYGVDWFVLEVSIVVMLVFFSDCVKLNILLWCFEGWLYIIFRSEMELRMSWFVLNFLISCGRLLWMFDRLLVIFMGLRLMMVNWLLVLYVENF